jgi:epoxyqueuosine reductase
LSLISRLKTYAAAIGLDALAVTSAAPFAAEAAILRERSAADLYPAFITRNLAQRCDPTVVLPGCRSVIVAALSYHSREEPSEPSRRSGYVARYAQCDDYHQVLYAKLQLLAEFLTPHAPDSHRYKIQVDNGPCLERAAALRAGLGWQGKNNLLYVPGLGSWVVLGILLTNITLPHQVLSPQSRCGSCERCLKSCPTDALVGPYTIDPQRCLAYITQMPGLIPHTYRKLMGARLWGCDTCQLVCPHNAKLPVRRHAEWGEPLKTPDLIALLQMSPAEFTAQFGRTALHWRGVKTLRRNAAIVLGNLGDREAVGALAAQVRHHPSPIQRAVCAWALGEIGGESARSSLSQALQHEREPQVRAEIQTALAAIGG